MASTAEEDTGQSSDGSWSQPPQTGPRQAEEGSRCPICLGHVNSPAYVTHCMHKFCLMCIWQWCRDRDSCPVCRQPIAQLLHSVRGDRDYQECPIGLVAVLHGGTAREGGLQPVLAVMTQRVQDQQHLAGRSRPRDAEWAQRLGAAPGPSDAHSLQAPMASHEMAPLGEGERPAGPAAPLEPENGTE